MKRTLKGARSYEQAIEESMKAIDPEIRGRLSSRLLEMLPYSDAKGMGFLTIIKHIGKEFDWNWEDAGIVLEHLVLQGDVERMDVRVTSYHGIKIHRRSYRYRLTEKGEKRCRE